MRDDLHSDNQSEEEYGSLRLAKKESFTARTTRGITRTLPIFAELIIIGFYLFVFGIFLYYAYIYKTDNSGDCIANAQSTEPQPTNSDTVGVNVT